MADSTVTDVAKMKVVELRKELKSRGLSYAGDKSELIARLQTAMSQDDHGDLDWDLDSDGVLEDEDDKNHADILDDPVTDNVSTEELALAEQAPAKAAEDAKPPKTLKRKITMSDTDKDKSSEDKSAENTASKKIVLNRAISVTTSKPVTDKTEEKIVNDTNATESNKVKITADIDPKTRLEMRAKRFGLPVKMTDAERKEARKQRFGHTTVSAVSKADGAIGTGTLSENLEKLKKRADRFGQSVSKIMTDIENKERLEKRKAKFGAAK